MLLLLLQHLTKCTPMFLAIQRILQPIEAEASALLLAAKLAAAINVQRPVFITDNEVLATAANKRDFVHSLGHWSLQPILADFIASTANMTHSTIKIGTNANSVADNLARKARRTAVPSSCLFSCES